MPNTWSLLWGIDLGGTKIEAAILDPGRDFAAVDRMRLPTEAAKGYGHIVAQVDRLVTQLESRSGLKRPDRIGIGTPGCTDPKTGQLKNSNTVCLNGRPLAADLATALRSEAILANDANCFALAEATLGAARNFGVVIGLIIGTGVGGGLVVHGHVIEGRHGIGGEWGHIPLCGETTACYCGRRGCVETAIAGPSLERFYRESGGDNLRLPEIAQRAAAGEGRAAAVFDRLREKFAEGIGTVINIVDPDAIVIGGGVGNLDLFYTPETRQAVARHVFNGEVATEFLRPQLGDSAGVFGAAMLGCDRRAVNPGTKAAP